MIIRFTICGNQEDPNGNAIPKIKKTARQQWTPQAQRYQAWKDYVRAAMEKAEVDNPKGRTLLTVFGKIAGTPNAEMTMEIHWANEKHADPESVFGSIADAIFENDKHLAGSFTFRHAEDKKGKVEVMITI